MPSVAVDDRIAARRREVKRDDRRRRLRRTIVAGLVLLLLGVGAYLERSGLVALQEIEVTGTQRLAPADVLAAADLPLGTSTLRLRLAPAAQRIAALPYVRDVDVSRVDPLTVRISVTERTPVLVVSAGERSWLVDDDGIVLEPGVAAGLATVTAPSSLRLVPGDQLDSAPAVSNAHRAMRGLPGPLRAEIVRYDAIGPDELDLWLRDGRRVRFGRAERIDEKARALGAVLEDLGATEVAYIDVRAPGAPVVGR